MISVKKFFFHFILIFFSVTHLIIIETVVADCSPSSLRPAAFADKARKYRPRLKGKLADAYPALNTPARREVPLYKINHLRWLGGLEETTLGNLLDRKSVELRKQFGGRFSERFKEFMAVLNLFQLGCTIREMPIPIPAWKVGTLASEYPDVNIPTIRELSIDQIAIDIKTKKLLSSEGITTLGDILYSTRDELLAIRGFGPDKS